MFRKNRINIEALCAAPPEALAHSPSQMPLSCLVAPLSQRELHKDGGGSGNGEWRGEEGARRPGPEGQFLHHVLRHALRNALRNVLRRVLDVLVLHVLPKESAGERWKMARVPQRTPFRFRSSRRPTRPPPRPALRPASRPAPRSSRARPSRARPSRVT